MSSLPSSVKSQMHWAHNSMIMQVFLVRILPTIQTPRRRRSATVVAKKGWARKGSAVADVMSAR
jgi:hypothetical protein